MVISTSRSILGCTSRCGKNWFLRDLEVVSTPAPLRRHRLVSSGAASVAAALASASPLPAPRRGTSQARASASCASGPAHRELSLLAWDRLLRRRPALLRPPQRLLPPRRLWPSVAGSSSVVLLDCRGNQRVLTLSLLRRCHLCRLPLALAGVPPRYRAEVDVDLATRVGIAQYHDMLTAFRNGIDWFQARAGRLNPVMSSIYPEAHRVRCPDSPCIA